MSLKIDTNDYKITVNLDGKDITNNWDWTQIEKDVLELFQAAIQGGKPIDKGTIVLTGDFSNLTNPATRKVTLLSGEVHYKEGADAKVQPLTALSGQTLTNVQAKITQIGQDFATLRPVTSGTSKAPSGISLIESSLTDVDTNGQCLDKSLAHLIKKKTNSAESVDDIAIKLRNEAAAKMKQHSLMEKQADFVSHHLIHSIASIPNLQNDYKDIDALLKKGASAMTADDRKKLREFYAFYITDINKTANKPTNYLDSAFLYVLPLIDDSKFGIKLQCAVVQNDEIIAVYPKNAKLTPENTLFVHYNGSDHYKAIEINNQSKPHLQSFSAIRGVKALNTFYGFVDNTSNTVEVDTHTKEQLLILKNANEKAYNAIAGLIYEHDVEKKNPAPSNVGMPWGDYRINNLAPKDLRIILKAITVAKMKAKI